MISSSYRKHKIGHPPFLAQDSVAPRQQQVRLVQQVPSGNPPPQPMNHATRRRHYKRARSTPRHCRACITIDRAEDAALAYDHDLDEESEDGDTDMEIGWSNGPINADGSEAGEGISVSLESVCDKMMVVFNPPSCGAQSFVRDHSVHAKPGCPGVMIEEIREPNATNVEVVKGQDNCQLEDLKMDRTDPLSPDAESNLKINKFKKESCSKVPRDGSTEVTKEATQKAAHATSSSSATKRERKKMLIQMIVNKRNSAAEKSEGIVPKKPLTETALGTSEIGSPVVPGRTIESPEETLQATPTIPNTMNTAETILDCLYQQVEQLYHSFNKLVKQSKFSNCSAEASYVLREAEQVLASFFKDSLVGEIERLNGLPADTGAARNELEEIKKCCQLEVQGFVEERVVMTQDQIIEELKKKLEEAVEEARKQKKRADGLKNMAAKIHDKSQYQSEGNGGANAKISRKDH